ncbi:unnamed protein product [Meloidogyne enterolobii]|uniref:Uncharacterized protein n=1 Tax=Meloidogyne enterolobii TaxID=390850 RepID=A0ACB0Y258_MELEN
MPPQGKDKNKNGSQLGGANSGPKSGGRNNGQKRFEEAGKSSSSSKQNEETKKVLRVKNFLSVVSGGGDEAILSENSFVAGSGLGIILEEVLLFMLSLNSFLVFFYSI